MVDNDVTTSWSVRRRGERTDALLIPQRPFSDEGGGTLTVTIVNRDNLGCFRLLATSAPEPRELLRSDETPADDEQRDDGFRLCVNLGGEAWTDPDGNKWVESKSFDSTTFGHEGGRKVTESEVDNPVANSALRGLIAFRAIVPNGTYEVQLYFSEHWTNNVNGRVFSMTVERQPVIRPVNVFRAPGMGQPYVHTIPNVMVEDDRLDVDLLPAEGSSTILNGISIRQLR
jgi:hypothetical protein